MAPPWRGRATVVILGLLMAADSDQPDDPALAATVAPLGEAHATATAGDSSAGPTVRRGGEGPRPGDMLARFRLLELLGAGGMGEVFRARDVDLERDVAIKVLTRRRGESRARLLDEARAMAKLRHRHVVAIYEVGTEQGEDFLALELFGGGTIREWLRATPRPWREIVRAFREAGEGLAAAHAAGIVHRDFKPGNVLVDDDGRVAVADFGLAVAASDADPGGAILGTPAYMSPEQFDGRPADARSDQFGFCVALYEALWGRHPFAFETITELIDQVARGDVAPPPRSRVPRRLRRAILRGLAVAPSARHADMPALLGELRASRRAAGPSRWAPRSSRSAWCSR